MANTINKRDLLDLGMMLAIFFMSIIEVSSFYFQHKYDSDCSCPENIFITYYYPLHVSLVIWVSSSFFLFRILRFNACFCTQAITTLFFFSQSITVFLIFTGYNENIYYNLHSR
jgi:hypothetical protein